PLPGALAAPEPDQPQGEYASTPVSVALQMDAQEAPARKAELLAPAGGLDAAFAAFQYGADAIYLGLKKFSARAEAENFTLEELSEVVAFAHQLQPPRRVFVALNTLIRNDELPELVETLLALESMKVDAVIIQDLGVYHILRNWFPSLEIHGSTQLAIHNREGAEALRRLDFTRVVLARELTLEEMQDITRNAGIETEVFIHGALCYSYSGLCLFSSQTLGRSGNRGKCAYSCRDSFTVEGAPETLRDGNPTRRDPSTGFPFSMKDLALPDHLLHLEKSGVSSFKIEGRKKSPQYVATTTDYYRRLLDSRLPPELRQDLEADLQTVFSRPWTHLFVDSHKDKEVADRDTVGHRGTPIGKVLSVTHDRRGDRLRFQTSRALERHDGLQVDLPTLGKPYGFAIERMWVQEGRRWQSTFEAAPDSFIEVELPPDHPDLPHGSMVYCSSSQKVKQRYRHDKPKPGLHRSRLPIHVEVRITAEGVMATGKADPDLAVVKTLPGPLAPARDPSSVESAVRESFEKLGDTPFLLGSLNYVNDSSLFAPVSRLNALRRELTQELEQSIEQHRRQRHQHLVSHILPTPPEARKDRFRWSVKVDRVEYLDAFGAEDWSEVDEAVVDIARDHPAILVEKLRKLGDQIGRDRVRLALPAITRKWEQRGLTQKLSRLREEGWTRWEAANLSAWTFLGLSPAEGLPAEMDLATDWSVYVLNRAAAAQLLRMGVSRFALSPEDGLANMRPLLAEFGPRAVVIVHQDTPLFIAESCAYANLIGGCPGKANCRFDSMQMVSSHGEKVTAQDYHCRTIVLDQGTFCLSSRLKDLAQSGAVSLRADFIYRKYDPETVVRRWRMLREGKILPGGHAANFDRGVL
ncbi:MAG: peptidase U32 family protein, partial [Gemmataceae bacterium]